MLGGEILASAKVKLKREGFSWVCKAALATYAMKRLVKDVVGELDLFRREYCRAKMPNIVNKWIVAFVSETDGQPEDAEKMQKLLVKAASLNDSNMKVGLVQEVESYAGPREASVLHQALGTPSTVRAIEEILILSLFKTLFGLSYTGLELNTDYLDSFLFPDHVDTLIPQLLQLLPAFDVPVTTYRRLSLCCSVVQCGGYVLMPRILAEEKISDIDSTPFLMIAGRLAKDGNPVHGFFYAESHRESEIDASRPEARIPSDASDSNAIKFLYEEADYGYKFWTEEAGHRLNLDGLIQGILLMHSVDDGYDKESASTTWTGAAPHHMLPRGTNRGKTLYLSYNNVAGRRLALSRAGDALSSSVVHFGKDYRKALAYAERFNCHAVIL